MTKDYIERGALLSDIADLKKSPWYNDDYGFGTMQARHDGVTCVEELCVKKAPAADVVEVKHGHWIEHKWAEEDEGCLVSNFECSQCHDWERKTSDYCPNCGAKMDGECREG